MAVRASGCDRCCRPVIGDLDILGVGDIGARRADLGSIFRGCRETLRGGLTFGQLETTVSDRGAKVPNAKLAMRAPLGLAPVLRDAGFDVMSFAGNHCLDWGYDAFDDTLAHMAAADITLCGAGRDLASALEPVILERNGVRVAFIAASAILPEGYAAEADRPGCAPLRAHTLYEQIEHDQPGTPARIRTAPHGGDLQALIDMVRTARAAAEIVIVSLHWGIHMVKGELADYQRRAGHALIDAGADGIFGHHPHIMKGIELHRGRPIFYSLGNFAIEQPHVWDPAIVRSASFRHLVSLNSSWSPDNAYMLPEETRITGVARLVVREGRLAEVRFLPAWIEDDSAPVMLAAADPRFERVRAYLEEVTASEGLSTRFHADGDELVIRA
ncbi:CapA family protein [Sphingosinicella sp. BN140058]|uniref:CapA family protein n=1 Tax=Sphingosinicella sp. BN140058 TaxID=1892855 RepID=UPI0013EAE850|nr:CapA family protein [Sphingosinicella sp. BN140058]